MISVHFKRTIRERLPEWISAFCLVAWGVILLGEPAEFWLAPYFDVLSNIASQQQWSISAIIIGILRLIALGINGAWRPTAHLRAAGSFFGACLWSAIFISFLGLSWNPPSLALVLGMIITDVIALWYAAGDAKLADIKAYKLHHAVP